MRKNRVFDFWFRKQYVIAGALVLFASFGLTALYSHNQEQERVRLEQELAEQAEQQRQMLEAQKEEEVEKASSIVAPKPQEDMIVGQIEMPELLVEAPTVEGAPIEEESVEEAPVVESSSVHQPKLHFTEESELMWPMEGNVIMNYSMESTIYHATLDQYKYNPAIIIAGDVNNKVYAVAQGKITDIAQNEVTGMTVTVDLGDGYEVIYGQLKELNFDKGDYLEAGHVIGYVSEPTKYYSVEGSNLYFEMRKDGAPIDPIAYFE